jgi:nucleoside-diphosphate-sugar epimerase
MRILVIGGTRFIGPRVVGLLATHGHQVTVFHRGQHSSPLPPGVAELTHPDAAIPVRRIPDQARAIEPDVVLHMIAMGEEDAEAAVAAFAGIARRIVVPSSGDVYKAYGIFMGIETGPPVPVPLDEDAALRTVRYPYRKPDTPREALEFYYDKVLVEAGVSTRADLPATILRLPKVYGPEDNRDLSTVYGFRQHPNWRWTHGFVDNVAAAIGLAVLDDRATGKTYNVGEARTPTVGERLRFLPARPDHPVFDKAANFEQDIVYDTSRIRRELGYREVLDERKAMIDLLDGKL